MRGIVLAALALTALLPGVFAAGCGQPDDPNPPPEVVETAESQSRDVRFDAPYAATPEGDDAPASLSIDGRIFGRGPVGVVLAHMRPADQTSWYPFATQLAATGKFTVLTFDFRGYGHSDGEKQFDRVDLDVQAAFDYVRGVLGIDRVYLVGASMGGTASLIVAARVDAAGVVSISSPDEFPPLDALAAVDDISEPKLFITAEDDIPAARSQEAMWAAASAPKEQQIYTGGEHGTALLQGTHAADLEARLLAFLSR
jgi:pimeloyl-ACP methyl ester carboxylesterase